MWVKKWEVLRNGRVGNQWGRFGAGSVGFGSNQWIIGEINFAQKLHHYRIKSAKIWGFLEGIWTGSLRLSVQMGEHHKRIGVAC